MNNDPKGASGAKKTPLGLIPPIAMEHTALVHKLGADKYGAWNWRDNQVSAITYVNAILRHLNAWRDGEDLDPESGISHIAHIACSCNILMDAELHGTLVDDRWRESGPRFKKEGDEPESCACGRYKVSHFLYGLICEDCEIFSEIEPFEL